MPETFYHTLEAFIYVIRFHVFSVSVRNGELFRGLVPDLYQRLLANQTRCQPASRPHCSSGQLNAVAFVVRMLQTSSILNLPVFVCEMVS
jgi:hypothetical protein